MLQWARSNMCKWDCSTTRAIAETGNLEMLVWAKNNQCQIYAEGIARAAGSRNDMNILTNFFTPDELRPIGKDICYNVASEGHMEVMKYLFAIGSNVKGDVVGFAASHGQFEMVKWLVEDKGLPNDKHVCIGAVKSGHFEMLKWSHARGAPCSAETAETAAYCGHLEILNWLKEIGCNFSPQVVTNALYGRHLNIVKWGIENGLAWGEIRGFHYYTSEPYSRQISCSDIISAGGDIDMVIWAKEKGGRKWSKNEWIEAVEQGNLEMLKWLRDYGCPTSSGAAFAAKKRGNLEILQWVLANSNDDLFELTCEFAGSIEVLKWLHENGYPWGGTCEHAAFNKDLQVLKWAHEHGCPWKADGLIKGAISSRNMDIFKYVLKIGCEWNLEAAKYAVTCFYTEPIKYVISKTTIWENRTKHDEHLILMELLRVGFYKDVKWCIKNGFPLSEAVMTQAVSKCTVRTVKLLIKYGCPWNTSELKQLSLRDTEMVEYIKANLK